ncbi:MAG: hypothetical protein DRP60_04110 [Spirochaetes bacterium]|nr:MAG: hypothetical protein DRP60_04110 [Spirochaetota bacterium]
MKKLVLLIILTTVLAQILSAIEGYFEIINETGFDIYYVYVSKVADDSWGEDELGDDVIANGETYQFYVEDPEYTKFDIRVEDLDGDFYTIPGVDLASQTAITFTRDNLNPEESDLIHVVTIQGKGGEHNGYIEIYNNIGRSIHYVYLRKVSTEEWGSDLLGNEIMPKRGLFKVTFEDFADDVLDVRFEDRRGRTYSFMNVPLSIGSLEVMSEDRD